jgi:hypothetical protein
VKSGLRSLWKWMTLKRSLSVSARAMSSMGCVCSCEGRELVFEYRCAWRVMAALMLSASWWSRTSWG